MVDWLNTWFGPSLISATAAACSGYITFRQHEVAWYKEFRELHEEFWRDEEMGQVRAWIACSPAYQEVSGIIARRNAGEVSSEEYKYLDKIDKFCALMVRIADMDARPTTLKQDKLWEDLYFYFWIKRMRKDDRKELTEYVGTFWMRLLEVEPRSRQSLWKRLRSWLAKRTRLGRHAQ